jgi:hypothetical protein
MKRDSITLKLLLPEAPARFDVRPPVDVFDNWESVFS